MASLLPNVHKKMKKHLIHWLWKKKKKRKKYILMPLLKLERHILFFLRLEEKEKVFLSYNKRTHDLPTYLVCHMLSMKSF